MQNARIVPEVDFWEEDGDPIILCEELDAEVLAEIARLDAEAEAARDSYQRRERAAAEKESVEYRRTVREAFQSFGGDIKDVCHTLNPENGPADDEYIAALCGYRGATWDDQKNIKRREKEGYQRVRAIGTASRLQVAQNAPQNAPESPKEAVPAAPAPTLHLVPAKSETKPASAPEPLPKEAAALATLLQEAAQAARADKAAKTAARETGKKAKRALEMLREVIKPHGIEPPPDLPPLVLEPVDASRFVPYLRETSAFFHERARAAPDVGRQLETFWRYGVERLPSWIEERRAATRATRPLDFLLGDWRCEMVKGAWEITQWR